MNIPLARRFSLMLLLFLAAFTITCMCIHGIILKLIDPLDLYAVERSEKLHNIRTDRKNYAVAAFGSSRVHTSFDPRIFDVTLQETGLQKATSYNLAVAGGSQTEQREMAARYIKYLKQRSIKQSLIILELSAGLNLQNAHLTHPRAINLYDTDTVAFAAKFTDSQGGFKRVAGRAGYAVAAGALHQMNIGMLAAVMFRPELDHHVLEKEFSKDRRGFMPLNTVRPKELVEVEKLFSERSKVRDEIAGTLQPGNHKLVEDLQKLAGNDISLQFAYVIIPTLNKNLLQFEVYPDFIRTPTGEIPIINFEKDADLFTSIELWGDPGHLNEKGGALLTSHLAKRLIKLNLLPDL